MFFFIYHFIPTMTRYLKKTSAAQKVVEELKTNGFVQPQGIGPRSRNIVSSVPRPTPIQLVFRDAEPMPKASPETPKSPKTPKLPKAPKELMTSVKLQQKAAGYMLAAANARSRE
jgi:hypothetical protein